MRRHSLVCQAGGRAAPIEMLTTETVLERMRGLLGRAPLRAGEAMVIDGCNLVHTAGMSYPIDLVFVDRGAVIRKITPAVPPWRASGCLRAARVVELAAGEAARRGWCVGTRLGFLLQGAAVKEAA